MDAAALADVREALRPQQEQQVLKRPQASCASRRDVQPLPVEAVIPIREQLA